MQCGCHWVWFIFVMLILHILKYGTASGSGVGGPISKKDIYPGSILSSFLCILLEY